MNQMNTPPSNRHGSSGSSEELPSAIPAAPAEDTAKGQRPAAQPGFAREYPPGDVEDYTLTEAEVAEEFEGYL